MPSAVSDPTARPGRRSTRRVLLAVARLVAAAALAVDAYVHAKLADRYDPVVATVSQGDLFRIEAGLAALAALLVLVRHRRPADAFGLSVAAGGLAALLLYRYVDVGAFGPFPDMYEPVWFADKWASVFSQAAAIAATAFLLVTAPRRRRTARGGAPSARGGDQPPAGPGTSGRGSG